MESDDSYPQPTPCDVRSSVEWISSCVSGSLAIRARARADCGLGSRASPWPCGVTWSRGDAQSLCVESDLAFRALRGGIRGVSRVGDDVCPTSQEGACNAAPCDGSGRGWGWGMADAAGCMAWLDGGDPTSVLVKGDAGERQDARGSTTGVCRASCASYRRVWGGPR